MSVSYIGMSTLIKIVSAAIVAAGTVYVATAVFQFLGIGVETYGIYMMFMVAIAMLYALLPEKAGSLFSKPVMQTPSTPAQP